MHRPFVLTGLVAAGAFAASVGSASAADVRFRAVQLEPPVGTVVAVHDINELGVVSGTAGSVQVNPGQHAVVWTDGAILNLDPMFDISHALFINDAGVTAGTGSFCPPLNGPCIAMIARSLPGGQFEPIGTLGGISGEVLDLNEAGGFVGWWYNDDNLQRAFLYTEAGGLVNLGTLGGFASQATAINDSRQIVGWSYTAQPALRAVRWIDGTIDDLGTLGGDASVATDTNNSGVIVGWSKAASGDVHAFRWVDGGPLQDIQTIPTAVTSRARLVNEAGMIGGDWSDGVNDAIFIHTDAGGMVDLGAPPVDDFDAFHGPADINTHGWMIGVGATFIEGYPQAVAWFASPEHGPQVVTDLLVDANIEIISVSAINDAGQIAAMGQNPTTFEIFPLLLEPVAPADLNADGSVNVLDLLAMLSAWGSCPAGESCPADLSGDGVVNVLDLLQLLSAWG